MKNLENYGVVSLDAQEVNAVNGGAGWEDLLWMFAKDIVKGYVAACGAAMEGFENGTIDGPITSQH